MDTWKYSLPLTALSIVAIGVWVDNYVDRSEGVGFPNYSWVFRLGEVQSKYLLSDRGTSLNKQDSRLTI